MHVNKDTTNEHKINANKTTVIFIYLFFYFYVTFVIKKTYEQTLVNFFFLIFWRVCTFFLTNNTSSREFENLIMALYY